VVCKKSHNFLIANNNFCNNKNALVTLAKLIIKEIAAIIKGTPGLLVRSLSEATRVNTSRNKVAPRPASSDKSEEEPSARLNFGEQATKERLRDGENLKNRRWCKISRGVTCKLK